MIIIMIKVIYHMTQQDPSHKFIWFGSIAFGKLGVGRLANKKVAILTFPASTFYNKTL